MIAQIITLVATVATAIMVVGARSAVRETTLTTAWGWAVVAACSWCVAAVTSLMVDLNSSAIGQLWYVAAVLTLCPWIAVLGARRPTVRVWNWFVVLPLVAVLLWPVALCWMPRGPDRLMLETPHLIGFGLVLVMGTGNYLGTRFTLPAIIVVVGEVMLFAAIDGPRTSAAVGPGFAAIAACVVFSGVLSATRMQGRRPSGATDWDRLWEDFRNSFGIVWANRIAERVNADAVKADWAVRLQPRGFVSSAPGQPADFSRDAAQVEHTLRWLLRRFVDDGWINSRLNQPAPGLKDGGSLAGNDSIEAASTSS